MTTKHLWQYDHPYYGADGHTTTFDSFTELRTAIDNLDEDMNLVYRFDWHDDSQPHRDDLFLDGEDRSDQRLRVFTIMPRKSDFAEYVCPISYDQENEVIAWLSGPRVAGHLRTLWAPILGSPGEQPPTPGPERPVQVDVVLDDAAVRAAIDATVRQAVEEHRQRWYAQGWHDAIANQATPPTATDA